MRMLLLLLSRLLRCANVDASAAPGAAAPNDARGLPISTVLLLRSWPQLLLLPSRFLLLVALRDGRKLQSFACSLLAEARRLPA